MSLTKSTRADSLASQSPNYFTTDGFNSSSAVACVSIA
jgi:hypothetical protein